MDESGFVGYEDGYVNTLFSERIGQGPDLVLLHGWGFHSDIWQPLLPQLTQHFRVTMVDLPGFGRSPWALSSYDLTAVCELLLAVVPEKASYLGWSMGGLVASQFALQYPQKVMALIQLASSPCFVKQAHWPGITKSVLSKFQHLAHKNPERMLLRFLQLQLSEHQQHGGDFEYLKQVMFQCQPSAEVLFSGLECLSVTDLRPRLSEIKVPQYYILGEDDGIVPIAVASALTHYVRPEVIEVLPSGHMPFLQCRQQCIDLVKQFVGSVSGISQLEALTVDV